MRTLIKVIKEHLDLLFGTFIGLISAILVRWELNSVQLISSVIILILVLTGLFKVGFSYNFKKHDPINKVVENQRPMKAIKIAQNPTQIGEELGELIIETTKGSKKMIKWIKNNKGALVSWLVAVIGLLELIFNWLGEFLPLEIGFNIIGVIITIIGLIVATLTTGFGSIQFKEALAQLKDQLNGDETDLKDITSIKYLKKQITIYNKSIDNLEKEIEKLNKKNSKVINDYQTCQHLNITIDNETKLQYDKYKAELNVINQKINSKKNALQIYQNKLNQYE